MLNSTITLTYPEGQRHVQVSPCSMQVEALWHGLDRQANEEHCDISKMSIAST